MRSLKAMLRKKLIGCKPCYRGYLSMKYLLGNIGELRYFLNDIRNTWRDMYWGNHSQMTPTQLQAKLLFYYHKIEKGLCMPGKKRLFALDVVPQVVNLLLTWEKAGNSIDDPVYVGAINSLRAYSALIHREGLDPNRQIIEFADEFLQSRRAVPSVAVTPIVMSKERIAATVPYEDFKSLCEVRRSYRDYADIAVQNDLIERAVELAQLSPSACNRQPNKVYVIKDTELKRQLLSYQNGNAGFGHIAPVLLIITADASHFFGPIERHQPYVDGGLFSMSLLYALQVQGVVSCCLNWCVAPKENQNVHKILGIPNAERIIMFMVAGYPVDGVSVPKSHRKSIENIVVYK